MAVESPDGKRFDRMTIGINYYGLNRILMEYAGLPAQLPLPVAVQHGWQRYPTTYESQDKPPEVWVWTDRIAREYEQFFRKDQIRVVGSFFCYLYDSVRHTLPAPQHQGSIVIPTHSSHFARVEVSSEGYAEMLHGLKDEFKPITVMLYYLDMTERNIQAYKKRGFDVVSNGTLFSDDFLHNFIRHVHGKKYCIFNEPGSGVFYAGYMGLKPYYFGPDVVLVNNTNPHLTEEFRKRSSEFDKNFLKSLTIEHLIEELGANRLLSPDEMRNCILKNYTPMVVLKLVKNIMSWNLRRLIGGPK